MLLLEMNRPILAWQNLKSGSQTKENEKDSFQRGEATMERKRLQDLFGMKVFREFDEYRRIMLQNYPEEIFNKAYQNDCFINFYEHLLAMSEKLTNAEMQYVIFFPDFLTYLYDRWITAPKVSSEEMYEFIYKIVEQETKEFMEVA